jgi:glycosyltransferase involved in cell wall biosynthesis
MIVLISHYNNPEGLKKSLESIEKQGVETLVVDDGSSSKPYDEDLKRDSVKYIFNNTNLGLENSLNIGLDYILKNTTHKYVARLDCGDIALTNRFALQKEYLEKNPDVHLIGSHVSFIDNSGLYLYTYKVPLEHDDIRKKMFIKNSFIHPAVMFRVDVIRKIGHYPLNFKYAEDYALFFNIVKNYKTANINKVLTVCTLDKNGISNTYRRPQMRSKFRVLKQNKRFSVFYFYGLIRNAILYFIPNSMNLNLKSLYFR